MAKLECPYQSPEVNKVNNKQDIVKNRKLLETTNLSIPWLYSKIKDIKLLNVINVNLILMFLVCRVIGSVGQTIYWYLRGRMDANKIPEFSISSTSTVEAVLV